MDRSFDKNIIEKLNELEMSEVKKLINDIFKDKNDKILLMLLYFGLTLKEVSDHFKVTVSAMRVKVKELEDILLEEFDLEAYEWENEVLEFRDEEIQKRWGIVPDYDDEDDE